MELEERKQLYAKALKKWGLNLQLTMLMEECAEVQQAASKIIRGKGDIDNLREEIGDAEILFEQMKIIFPGDYEASKNRKLEKFKKYLEDEK